MTFESNVFLNCPFDDEYLPLRYAILFAIVDCGFIPRCALEIVDGSKLRMHSIKLMIKESRFGIHDISRTQLDPEHRLPRFNMPLEMGIFIGAASFGGGVQRSKSCLILDTEQYRYQKYISDIAGQDIRMHKGLERLAISHVRNWLSAESAAERLPGGQYIFARYLQFRDALPSICTVARTALEEIEYQDFLYFVFEWIKQHPLPPECRSG